MITINQAGVIAMNACQHFEQEVYKKLGLRPVFKIKRELFDKTHKFREEMREINGKQVKAVVIDFSKDNDETKLPEYPTDKEVDEFIRLRETFCAEELLRKVSWASFVNRCKREKITDVIQRHRPCEDPFGQCNIDCPRFNNCDQAQNVEYLYKEEQEYDYW